MSLTHLHSLPSSPACADSELSGPDHSVAASLSTTRPQHKFQIEVSELFLPPPQFQKASVSNNGMSSRKRCSDSLIIDPNTAESRHALSQTGADSSIKTPLSNKKQRVSFCQTTKPPSHMKIQRPSSNIQKLSLPNIIMKNSVSCTALPQLSTTTVTDLLVSEVSTGELDLSVSPANFVKTIVLQSKSITGTIRGEDIISDASARVKKDSYFLAYTPEHLEAYTTEMVSAVQAKDVETLRSHLQAGHLMQASNRFGESMLHTSCRRGFTDVFEFFVNEAMVCPRVKDDMGRTPMHDVCWSSAAPNHDIMKMLILAAPELLLSKDKRGHSPFDYARREYWPSWVTFLNENRQFIVNSLVSSYLESLDPITDKESEDGGLRSLDQ